MKNRRNGATFAWAVLWLAGAASAAETLPAATDSVRFGTSPARVTLDSKLRLVQLQLTQSPAVQRIRQSKNAQAKRKITEAQALYAKAEAESMAGRAEVATLLLDESLLHSDHCDQRADESGFH